MFRFFDSTANLDIDQEANGMTTTVSVSGISSRAGAGFRDFSAGLLHLAA